MFKDFNFSLLDDPDFKEDSVREEIVVPLLRELGYTAAGPAKIVRSKGLTHPFVFIGSKRFDVKIIPDYLLYASSEHKWILDAKGPNENILKGRNPEQAFSYAIHPEVRASRYALCNGRQISIFDVSKKDPILVLDIVDFPNRFSEVEQILTPKAFTKPHIFRFKPDMGLFLYKLGYGSNQILSFIPMGIPFIAKINDNLYAICVEILWGDKWLAATLDFDRVRLSQLFKVLPELSAKEMRDGLERRPFEIEFKENIPTINMDIRLGKYIHSNEDEDYCPFIVDKFY